ncbi:glycosyl hydrolase [Cellulomonas palmilytica]|uniref:glycosyl hydrolase n=1 Tax=Cellulomonas palmilytica TaxID=2608402 RepID=UPI001EEE920E|nr:glycosyl hydrolase [Cellulomonas palmilytica]UJP39135.1 1,3-beta-glucanase [Cellulomonas palmilytica]
MTRRAWLVGLVVLVAVVTAGVALLVNDRDRAVADGGPGVDLPGPPDARTPALDTAGLVAAVPAREVAKLPTARVADGVLPQTNRWYSGLVFGDEPVFAQPLSFQLTGSGFTLGLPQPVATEKTIAGPHVVALTVDVGASSAVVSAADPVGVTIDLLDDAGEVLGRVALAEGSPVVTFTAERDVTVRTDGGLTATPDGPAAAQADVAGVTWALAAPAFEAGATSLAAGEVAGWYALPEGATTTAQDALASAAQHPVESVDVTYGVDDELARTTLTYRTRGGDGAYVLSPHHRAGDQPEREGCGLGEYASVGGPLELCAGSVLSAFAPTVAPAGVPDVSDASDEQRSAILAVLEKDVAATPPFPSDTYFGGKALFRAATLVVLGEQLGADDVVADLRATTTDALREWAQPDGCTQRDARCVVYDPDARAAVGLQASFGSDELNDHHFHHGYLLAAAGLLAADDPTLADDLGVLDLLAADVANPTATDELPQLRSFDPYTGHSWASGPSQFADGNNQESSSEAVNAWNGLGLWALATGQDELRTQATWLASTESLAARTYWTAPDLAGADGFTHEVVSLVWGGKRDYATWFSPEPAAILGIQLIPMGPAQRALATDVDPERIRAAVEEAGADGTDATFGGYVLAYLALAGADDAATAWERLQAVPDEAIDDGTSRAALLAFVASLG